MFQQKAFTTDSKEAFKLLSHKAKVQEHYSIIEVTCFKFKNQRTCYQEKYSDEKKIVPGEKKYVSARKG